MICKCNNNSGSNVEAPKIKHVFGNVFILGIPLRKLMVTYDEGVKTSVNTDLLPLFQNSPIRVIFSKNGIIRYEFNAQLVNGYVVVEDKGTLPIGTYNITILATDSNGDPLRYKENFILEIVDTTAEANYDGLETFDGYFKFPILKYGGGRSSLIVIDDKAVKINEGTGFYGEITDDAVKLYARFGQSSSEITQDAVKLTIKG